MNLNWHSRYLQQSRWTVHTRRYLFERANLPQAKNVLEVGCGTGAILAEIPPSTKAHTFGVDISFDSARQASSNAGKCGIACCNGLSLPFPSSFFDITFCHFLLLWVKQPEMILRDMRRVTRPGGVVAAMAEPDYGGRIDFPTSLEKLGHWQMESLQSQGADPLVGRKLSGLFASAGINLVETGVTGGGWSDSHSQQGQELEWAVLTSDLAGRIPEADIQKIKTIELAAQASGERVLFVPTFYAWGFA